MGAELFYDGRIDKGNSQAHRHDGANCRSSQFCERAYNCYTILVLVVITLTLQIS
jgi:hypothetical protein